MSDLPRYIVVGNPVAHSLSPAIHRAFAEQLGDPLIYTKQQVAPGGFASFADDFRARGGCGLNVTVPFKSEAFTYAEQHSELASAAQAVNTLTWVNDECVGHNTDGVGLIKDLTDRHHVTVTGARVLLLGAGGAAQGVIGPLLDQRPGRLTIANRTAAKAAKLVAHFAARNEMYAPLIAAKALADVVDEGFDLIVNATAVGLDGRGDVGLVDPSCMVGAFCYDMSYGAAARFSRWAGEHGARASVDGLGMLVEQAAEAFYLWRHARPSTDGVFAVLRRQLDG